MLVGKIESCCQHLVLELVGICDIDRDRSRQQSSCEQHSELARSGCARHSQHLANPTPARTVRSMSSTPLLTPSTRN